MRLTVLGGCGGWPAAGQPRAPGPLRRPEPAAPGQGHAGRAASGAAGAGAARSARAGSRAGPPRPEATNPWQLTGSEAPYLSTARQAGAVAREAGAGRLVLTHLWPGTDPGEAVRAAAGSHPGEIAVASPGLVTESGST